MKELVEITKQIGSFSLDSIWFPLMIWTICCLFAFWILKLKNDLNPLFQYHLRSAALLSLPIGIIISFLVKMIPSWISAPEMETSFFIIQSPIQLVTAQSGNAAQQTIHWQEPSFFAGIFSLILIAGSAVMLFRFIRSYLELKELYSNLKLIHLEDVDSSLTGQNIKISFHDHHLVPFTFGWKNPVIVLPNIIKNDPNKFKMALQHELTHIKRGDYLLQLALSIIESIFWFHPLIHFANREIDTYREISCDQEVLSKSGFSVKSYANLLYELVPLQSGIGKLSVSMAVQNSTLKQRIKTMKYHKLHQTSFRQSIFFLLLMVVGITLPIACSDLRGPQGMSEEEVAQSEFKLISPKVEVNDIVIEEGSQDYTLESYHGLQITTREYGTFLISGNQFPGASLKATIDENTISFKLDNLKTVIRSESLIMDNKNVTAWVRHFPDITSTKFSIGKIPAQTLKSADFEKFMGFVERTMKNNTPPPPPSQSAEEDLGDYFVVVEEMPQPIGGIQAIQSKVEYPQMARRAGIEGLVTVQFIVNENGDVENARVVRGIGGGADEEALRVVREAKFKPGIQRGRPVRVQFALSINFKLSDSDFSSAPPPPTKAQ